MAGLVNSDLTQADELSVSDDGKFTVHGSGLFDDLMEAVTAHLTAQFNLGRLQGSDYAKVYAASLQSATTGAVSFLTGKVDADLLVAQIDKVKAEKALLDQQVTKIVDELVITKEKAVLEKDLLREQIDLTKAQKAKIDAEELLLDAKTVTEEAQSVTTPADGSVLAAQIEVFKEQAKGFYWNAKQKWAKLSVDAAAVDASQGEGGKETICNTKIERAGSEPVRLGGSKDDTAGITSVSCQ